MRFDLVLYLCVCGAKQAVGTPRMYRSSSSDDFPLVDRAPGFSLALFGIQ